MNVFKLSRADAENAITLAGLDLTVRGENLSAEEYVALTEKLIDKGVKL